MFITTRDPIVSIKDKKEFNIWYELYMLFSRTQNLYYICITKKELFFTTNYKVYEIPKDKIFKILRFIIRLNTYFPSFRFNEKYINALLIEDLDIDPYTLKILKVDLKEEKLYEK